LTPTGCNPEGKCIMVRFHCSRRGGFTLIDHNGTVDLVDLQQVRARFNANVF
jgi:hypothetical protein